MIRLFSFLTVLFFGLNVQAAPYTIDYDNSTLSFAGTHAGQNFQGVFEDWSADIRFDPQNLPESRITATFRPKSAKTGNPLYDGTLPQADWFDVSNHETARFVSQSFEQKEDGSFSVTGILSIRAIEKEKIFTFQLSDLSTAPIRVSGTFKIDRLAFDIGKKSDPKAEWVSQYIDITLNLSANP